MTQEYFGCERYERLDKLGEGTYGQFLFFIFQFKFDISVYKVRDKVTGEIVALKQIKLEHEDEGYYFL